MSSFENGVAMLRTIFTSVDTGKLSGGEIDDIIVHSLYSGGFIKSNQYGLDTDENPIVESVDSETYVLFILYYKTVTIEFKKLDKIQQKVLEIKKLEQELIELCDDTDGEAEFKFLNSPVYYGGGSISGWASSSQSC